LFEAILAGWVRQHRARMLAAGTIGPRERLVRRLQAHAGAWAWEWRAEHLEEWIEDLSLPRRGFTSRHCASIRSRSACSAST